MKKILVFLTVLLALCIPVSASAKTDAKKAYKKFMGENGVTYYSMIYFDSDSIPELLIDEMGISSLYTYKNKKVTPIANSVVDRHFEVIGFYKKRGCLVQKSVGYSEEASSELTAYWTMSGTAIYNKLQKFEVDSDSGHSIRYAWNKSKSTEPFMGRKTIKKATFQKKLKKITNGQAMKKISWKRYQAPSLTISPESARISVGDSITLKASGISGTVKWYTSSKYIATVSSNGTVTGQNPGTAEITAIVGGSSASCIITVSDDATNTYMQVADKANFVATMNSSHGGNISSITVKGNELTIYGGVYNDTRGNSYYGINKFYLSSSTVYSYEESDGSGKVSKNVFTAYYLDDFLEGQNNLHFLYINVENGKVTELCASMFEPN